MERKRDGLLPIGEAFGGLDGLVQAVRDASPQARDHYRLVDQVDALVRASETDPETGFMARWLMLCSLPRSNPGQRKEYVRHNGPYTLVLTAGHPHRLPFGNLPRLLVARGEFPRGSRCSGRLRWPKSAVDAWLAAREDLADEMAADRAAFEAAAAKARE